MKPALKYAAAAVAGAALVAVPLLSMMGDVVPILRSSGPSQFVPGGWIKMDDSGTRALLYVEREDWMPWGLLNDPELHAVLMADSTWTFAGQPVQRVTPARIDGMWRDDVITVQTKGGVWADLHRNRWDEVTR